MASAHLTSSSTDDSLARLNFAAEQEVGINEQIKCASCHFLAMPNHWDFVAGPPFTLFHPAVTAVRRPQRSQTLSCLCGIGCPTLVDKSFSKMSICFALHAEHFIAACSTDLYRPTCVKG